MNGIHLAHANLSGSFFQDINFSDLTIREANLGGATFIHWGLPPNKDGTHPRQRPVTFEECSLHDSTFTRCTMENVQITDCNTKGMKINGILVSDLLAAYKDKER